MSDQICNSANLLYCASYVDVTVFVARTLILEQTLLLSSLLYSLLFAVAREYLNYIRLTALMNIDA